MVDSDGADNAAIGINRVHGIEAPSEADFEHDGIELGIGKDLQDCKACKFKLRERHSVTSAVDLVKSAAQDRIFHLLTADDRPLVKAEQMGRCVHADAVPGGK